MSSTGNVFAGTGENNAGIGATAWTNPGNVTANDTTDATCNAGASSQYLVARNFGFALPAGATVAGITVSVEASEHSPGSETLNARLQDDTGALVGSTKTVSVNGTTKTVYTYGGTADVWGATLTQAIVNHANFGVRFWFTTSHDVRIDYVQVAVEYTEGSTALTTSVSTGGQTAPSPGTSKTPTGQAATGAVQSVAALASQTALVGSAIASGQGFVARGGGQELVSGVGSVVGGQPLAGAAITSGQGDVATDAGAPVAEIIVGAESAVGQGSSTQGLSVRMRSKKVGGGAATFALGSQLSAVSIGAVSPAPQIRPTSVAALLSAGSLAKARSVPLSGSASLAGVGLVVGSGGGVSTGSLNTSFTLTSTSTGTKPFSIGHAFKQGDVTTSDGVSVLGATAQVKPKNYWPDGSLKFAVISGTVPISVVNTPQTVSVALGTYSAGTDLTTDDLKAAMSGQTCSIDCGTFGVVSWVTTAFDAPSDFDAPFQSWVSGHLMSSWIYRKAVGSDAHLVAWLEVRLYSTGAVEVFPWIENAYLTVASPTNKSATYSFTLGSTQRFSQAIDIKHHTRIPLINGAAFSYWLGTDPAVTPAHNTAYLRSTKTVPNIGAWGAPLGTTLDALQQTYTPNTLAGDDSATGATGGSGSIISKPCALYLSSGGDARAYRGMMVHAMSAGSWSHHYRDEATNLPFAFSSWPNIRLKTADSSQSIPLIPVGAGGEVTGTGDNGGPAMSHLPGYAYFPYLVTGRWWFLEEQQFFATYAYGDTNRVDREGAAGIFTNGQVRGRAWGLNALAQAAAITPATHSLASEFISSWQSNTAHHRGRYVDGNIDSGTWVHPQGFLGAYSANAGEPSLYDYPTETVSVRDVWYDAAYQHNYMAAVLGYSSDIGILQSAQSISDHTAVRNHCYKTVIGRADDGIGSNYNWRRFICYAYPIGADALGLPVDTKYTASQSYAEMLVGFGLSSIPSSYGLTLKRTAARDGVGEIDLPSSTTASHAYGVTGLAALAMAAEHGATNASAAWTRISGASNFYSALTAFLTEEDTHWSVMPRASFSIPAVGTAQDLTTNTLNDAAGRNIGAFWNAWSGVAWAPWWGQYGSMIAGGGGHTDGDTNDLYRIDVASRAVTQIKSAATVFYKADNYCADTTTGWLWADSSGASTAVQVGEPFTEHFYAHLLSVPPDAISGRTDATNGWLYAPGRATMPQGALRSTTQAHMLRLGLATKFEAHGTPQSTTPVEAGAAYDPSRKRVWYKQGTTNDKTMRYRDLTTAAEGSQTFTGPDFVAASCVIEYSAVNDLVLILSYNQTLTVLDPVTGICTTPTKTGTAPGVTVREGWSWSDVWGAFVVYPGTGGNTFYFLKPTGDPRSAAWAWSSQTVTGTVYASAGSQPAYNRLRHCAALGNVLIWGAATNVPIQIIHVSAP